MFLFFWHAVCFFTHVSANQSLLSYELKIKDYEKNSIIFGCDA